MKNPNLSAVALVVCLSLAGLVGCEANRATSSDQAAAEAVSETRAAPLASDAEPAIDIADVLNYHFGVHG